MALNYLFTYEPIRKAMDETTFLSFQKLASQTVLGIQEKYTKDQANAELLKQSRKILGLSQDPQHYKNNPSAAFEVRNALNITANREALFQVIQETVNDTLVSGWQSDPYFTRFVEYKSYALGDTNSFYVPDNTEIIISEVAASNHDIIRQRLGAGREFSVNVKTYGAKVYMEAERYLMGVEDWTNLIGKITSAYTKMINNLIHDALLSAGEALPSPTQWNKTFQLTQENRSTLIRLIQDVAIATGTQPVIMGTATALDGLQNMVPSDIFAEDAKRDVYNFGRIGHFGQYELVEIPQAFAQNDTSKYLYDDAKLFIMPGNIDKFIKVFDEGGTQIYSVMDRDTHIDHTYDYEVVRKMGVDVIVNTRFGTVTIGE